MAYTSGTKYSGNANRTGAAATAGKTFAAAAPTAGAVKVENIFSTGLWTQEGGKSLATVQVREDVTIPAGSYINLYATDEAMRKENSPDFKITVRPGVLKPKQA